MQIAVTGVPWYRRQDYARILEVMEDAHVLPATFDKWLYLAEKVLQNAVNKGVVPVKAHIDPEQFVVWCRQRGLNVNADARIQFAATVASANYSEGSG
jgi:hypothetical protein